MLKEFGLSEFDLHVIEQGNEVESCARNLFPGGIEVRSRGEEAVAETLRLMASKTPTIFQATFIADGFLVRNDMLKYDPLEEKWDLFEVKGTNSMKLDNKDHDHITDAAFQVSVMRRAGVPLGQVYLVHLNKEYVLAGELDIEALFTFENITATVEEKLESLEAQMVVAREFLDREDEPPGGCECVYKSRRNHCASFAYSNPGVPDYSVHDISRIHKTKLAKFVDQKIFSLEDIPEAEDSGLSPKQVNQVLAHQRGRPVVDLDIIAEKLGALSYPLYFFDYEAYAPAIPVFSGYHPYMFIPFQFSLHILREPTGELEHIEFLHEDFSDPSELVTQVLREHVVGGTVVVWYQSFEKQVNQNIGIRLPQHKEFYEQFNATIFDLYTIFFDQHYIHPGFKGSASIKKVLPVVAPELSYANLVIHEGGQASNEWWRMVGPTTLPAEKKEIAQNLKVYCGQDTYAMYVIWKHLRGLLVGQGD